MVLTIAGDCGWIFICQRSAEDSQTNMKNKTQDKINMLCSGIIETLRVFERVQRRFHPLFPQRYQDRLAACISPLETARDQVLPVDDPIHTRLVQAADLLIQALHLIERTDDMQQAVVDLLKMNRKICRVQEIVYPLCYQCSLIDQFFSEESLPHVAKKYNQNAKDLSESVGIFHEGVEKNPYARGGKSLYVPELYDSSCSWPLVIALHGGYSHGRDFLWYWLREARSRHFILLCPSSLGRTWGISSPEDDIELLTNCVEDVVSRHHIDCKKILLTGMSDGATFALICGLRKQTCFTSIVPIAGVLPPLDLSHARRRRIFWVHGAHDWMFPVSRAQLGYEMLKDAGADVKLRIVKDLAHAYPREENSSILQWFNPALSLDAGK